MKNTKKLTALLLGMALLLGACASHREEEYRVGEEEPSSSSTAGALSLEERFHPLATPEEYADLGTVRSAPPSEESGELQEPAKAPAVSAPPAGESPSLPAASEPAEDSPSAPEVSQPQPPPSKEEPQTGTDVPDAPPKIRIVDSSEDSSGDRSEEEESSSAPKSASYNLNSTHFLDSTEQKVIDIINDERRKAGLHGLKVDESLSKGARIRSYELVKSGTFDHVRPDGRDWNTVLTEDVPTTFRVKGENLATAYYSGYDKVVHQSAQDWYDQWEGSPGHYENMMRETFDYIGVGIYYTYHDGEYTAVATTLFGAY